MAHDGHERRNLGARRFSRRVSQPRLTVSFRNLARASALYTVGNFLPRIGSFLLLPIYVRFLSTTEYGTVSLVTSVAAVLTIVYRLGLDGALMRLHFDESGARLRSLYSTTTLLALAAAAIGSVLAAVVLAPFFGTVFSGLTFVPYGLLAIGIAAAGAVSFSPAIYYRATGQAGNFLFYALAIFLASSTASLVMVLLGQGAAGLLIGQLVGAAFGALLTSVLVLRIAGLRYDLTLIAPALQFGLPLVPHLVSAWALRLADRLLISLLIGLPAAQALSELGAYSLGYQLGYVITVLVSSFNAAWSPWFFRVAHRPEAPSVFREMTTLLMAGLLVLGVGMAALAPQIIAVIARPGYEAAAGVLPIVAMASVLFAFYTMLTTIVFYAKATRRLALITLSAAALNIAANVVLIPFFGVRGAAWATFVGYGFFAFATWRYAVRLYPVSLDLRRLGMLSLAALLALLGANLGRLLGSPGLDVFARVAVALSFAAIAAGVAIAPARELRAVRWS